jgi:divalent metal cation (Fe/Co/Zn/Cd) transporter
MHQHTHISRSDSSTRIGWAFFLNVGFTIIEFIGGWLTNSTAIMADAVHDLGDSLSIGLAWLLNKISAKNANDTYSYGYQRFSLLGALINGVVLVSGSKLPGRSAVFNVAIMVLNNLIKPIFRFLCALVFITKGPIMLIASEDYSAMRLLGIWAPIEVRFFGSLAFLIPAELTGNPI